MCCSTLSYSLKIYLSALGIASFAVTLMKTNYLLITLDLAGHRSVTNIFNGALPFTFTVWSDRAIFKIFGNKFCYKSKPNKLLWLLFGQHWGKLGYWAHCTFPIICPTKMLMKIMMANIGVQL